MTTTTATTIRRCPHCRGTQLTAHEETAEYVVGDAFTIDVPRRVHVCGTCGERTITDEDRDAAAAEVGRRVARTTAVNGRTFAFMRQALGLTGKAAAAIVGVADETVSRWENGAVPVDRNAWLLVAILVDQEPGLRAASIERLTSYPRTKKAVAQ